MHSWRLLGETLQPVLTGASQPQVHVVVVNARISHFFPLPLSHTLGVISPTLACSGTSQTRLSPYFYYKAEREYHGYLVISPRFAKVFSYWVVWVPIDRGPTWSHVRRIEIFHGYTFVIGKPVIKISCSEKVKAFPVARSPANAHPKHQKLS